MARPRLLCFGLALLTLLLYAPVRHHEFILYDDPEYITDNSMVQGGLSAAGLKWAFTDTHASLWLPVTWLSHMLDCELFGLDPGAHHLVNALLHALNAALLLWVLFRATSALWPSAFIAAVFAWHPLRIESVAWAAERKDLLCGLFWLLTLGSYLKYAQAASRPTASTAGARASANWAPWAHFGLALLWFVLGLMSKPMIVTLPFVLLLLDIWPLKRLPWPFTTAGLRGASRVLWEKVPFFLLTGLLVIVTVSASRTQAMTLQHYSFGVRLVNALDCYLEYLKKIFWPVDLAVLYPLPAAVPWVDFWVAVVVIGVATWWVWRACRGGEQGWLLTGWFWFLGALVPVIGLVQVGTQQIADRHTYIPSIGLTLAITFAAAALVKRVPWGPRVAAGVAMAVLAGCLWLTCSQLGYWRNSATLFARAVAVTRDNAVARANLGMALERTGDRPGAMAQYREALRLLPGLAQIHNNLANLLDEAGQPEQAAAEYREALRLQPKAPMAHANFGTLLVKLGRFDEAMREYAEAARLDPADPRIPYLRGKALVRAGRPREGLEQLRAALRLDPHHLQTMVYLARVLAAHHNPAVRNAADAVRLAEQANQLTGGEQPFVLDTLAMAYAEAGRFDEARQCARRALDLPATGEDRAAKEALEARLKLYEANQPYRGD